MNPSDHTQYNLAARTGVRVLLGKMRNDDLVVCRCEEITQGEIKEAVRLGATSMNEVKRLTRAGMGLCQGKTCGRLVMELLAHETNHPLHEVPPPTSRPPTRVMPLGVLACTVTGNDQSRGDIDAHRRSPHSRKG